MKEIWRILKYTSVLKKYYLWISFFTILLAGMTQLQPLLTKAAIDEFTKGIDGGDTRLSFVALMAFLIFLTDLGQTVLSNISGYMGDMMSAKVNQIMGYRYFRKLLDLPQSYFDTELSGKIVNRMTRGIRQIADFMQMMSNNFLQFIFSTIFSLTIVAFYSWEVALMLGALYPIFIYMTARTSNKWQKYQKEINHHSDVATGRFNEGIGQIKIIKSFVQEARELRFFNKHAKDAVKLTDPQSRYWHNQDVARRVVLNIIFLFVYGYIFIQTGRGQFTIGEMVLLIQYAAIIRIPIFSISFLIDRTQRVIADTKEYFTVIDQQSHILDLPSATTLAIHAGELEFKDMSFSYSKNKPVLKDISLTVPPHTKTALVGESGEGKTTLTNLLMRLYEPESGTIAIDGQNIQDVTIESLRNAIGTVFQDPSLFSGTIRENISYARENATEKDVVAAAKAANAHEFIKKFDKGYDTEIGERGLKLSGGQKQRIAIARALLKDAPILILDEATSSLDSKSEQMVQKALETLMKGRTTIIIAHRLSTIQSVDQIVTIQNGRIGEVGSPKKLAKSGGIYAQLLQLQHGKNKEASKKKLAKFEIDK